MFRREYRILGRTKRRENSRSEKKGGLKISDRSGNCTAVSSAVTKKILLLISLQKALGISFPKEAAAEIQTISDMEDMIWKNMKGYEVNEHLRKTKGSDR